MLMGTLSIKNLDSKSFILLVKRKILVQKNSIKLIFGCCFFWLSINLVVVVMRKNHSSSSGEILD